MQVQGHQVEEHQRELLEAGQIGGNIAHEKLGTVFGGANPSAAGGASAEARDERMAVRRFRPVEGAVDSTISG